VASRLARCLISRTAGSARCDGERNRVPSRHNPLGARCSQADPLGRSILYHPSPPGTLGTVYSSSSAPLREIPTADAGGRPLCRAPSGYTSSYRTRWVRWLPGSDRSRDFESGVLLIGLPVSHRRLLHLAAPQASGADPDLLGAAVYLRPDPLQVWLPGSRRNIVGMTDATTGHRLLLAYCALLGHVTYLLDISQQGRLP